MVERGEEKFYYNETELYEALNECNEDFIVAVSYTHLTLPTTSRV